MFIELSTENKNFVIAGKKGTGKTVFAKKLIESFKSPIFLWDYHGEYKNLVKKKNLFFYMPKYKRHEERRLTELNTVVKKVVLKKIGVIRLFVMDEANQYCPNRKPLPFIIGDFVDNSRHYNLGTCYITRRFSQLNTDLTELADYIIIFKLTGKNDLRYCDELHEGLADAVRKLKRFEFVLVDSQGFNIHKPLPL